MQDEVPFCLDLFKRLGPFYQERSYTFRMAPPRLRRANPSSLHGGDDRRAPGVDPGEFSKAVEWVAQGLVTV